MDNTEDHASIDIKNLSASLRKEFKVLHPLSNECCIYRVPQMIRKLNEGRLYTPKIFSVGPLHHGRQELKAMEEFKRRCLQHFLRRTQVSLEEFLMSIKDRETRLRNCYVETIKLGSYDFVKMILIEFFKRGGLDPSEVDAGVDRIITKPWMGVYIFLDLRLIENQLPLFIFEDLFDLAKRKMHDNIYEGLSMSKLACDLLKVTGKELL